MAVGAQEGGIVCWCLCGLHNVGNGEHPAVFAIDRAYARQLKVAKPGSTWKTELALFDCILSKSAIRNGLIYSQRRLEWRARFVVSRSAVFKTLITNGVCRQTPRSRS